MARVILVEASPWDPATGQVVPVRLAGRGVRPYHHKGFADWLGGVATAPKVSTALSFDGSFTEGAIPSVSAVRFAPAQASTRARLARLIWTGAAVSVSSGDDEAAAPAWSVQAVGTVGGYQAQGGAFLFTMADMSGRLARPLVTATFAGSGGIEGPTEAAGRLKRRSWGPVWNVEARLLDKAYSIYEVGDPAHPLLSIDVVKDRGRPGPVALLAWQGSIAATFAALQAAIVPAGGAVVAPSIACVRWWTEPALLTADLHGEVEGGYVDTAAEIAARISTAAAGPALSNLAAAVQARPDLAGIHVDGSEAAAEVLNRLLLRVSLTWSVSPAGQMDLAEIAWAAPIATAVACAPIEREAVYAPVTKVSVGYRVNHRVHNDGEISAAVAAGDVVFPNGQTAAELQPAEPGATSGAPAGTHVNGRTAEQVTSDLDLNGVNYLTLAQLVSTRDALMLARTTLEGLPIGTVVATFKGEQQDANTAIAETFALLGAKSGDGQSWIINGATVRVGADAASAQSLDSLVTTIGDQSAAIDTFREVLVGPEGSTARAILSLDVNGKIAGQVSTNDGTVSRMEMLFDAYNLLAPDGTSLFYATAGKVRMPAVEVDTLKVNTAIVPLTVSASAPVQGAGAGVFTSVLSATLELKAAGVIEVIAAANQAFSSIPQAWDFRLLINGVQVWAPGGTYPGDSVPIMGSLACPAGQIPIELQWAGAAGVQLKNRILTAKGLNNTQ